MTISEFIFKAKRRFWSSLIRFTRCKSIYPYLYRSYWHYKFNQNNTSINKRCYFTARPNPGAGIGHQMANWIAGYWFAKQFGLKFAHIPFSTQKWEHFLGFGEDEITVEELIKKQGYKKIRLPLFNESNQREVDLIQCIINSYQNQKLVFVAEQDQFYRDQFGVIEDIKRKFQQAKARQNDKIIYSPNNFNIAIHIRRGDIDIGQNNQNPNLLMRWQNNVYFTNVLSNVLKIVTTEKPIAIYLYSQGEENDFEDFKHFPNLHLCLKMSARDSFLHMVKADLLITSKSSFSYKPALLNNGIKVCPKNFWHSYPDAEDWILSDDIGNFDMKQI